MQVVAPGIGDTGMGVLHSPFGFVPVLAEFLLVAHGSLVARKPHFMRFEARQRCKVFAIRERELWEGCPLGEEVLVGTIQIFEPRRFTTVGPFGQLLCHRHVADEFDIDRRAVYIHGVPESTKLPSTVRSVGPLPARVTVPIACGKIERVSK